MPKEVIKAMVVLKSDILFLQPVDLEIQAYLKCLLYILAHFFLILNFIFSESLQNLLYLIKGASVIHIVLVSKLLYCNF